MLGIPSTSSITIAVLALHTTTAVLSSVAAAAEEAPPPSAIDLGEWSDLQRQQRNGRRLLRSSSNRGSDDRQPASVFLHLEEDDSVQEKDREERLYKFRNILEASGALFLPHYNNNNYDYDTDSYYQYQEKNTAMALDWKDYIHKSNNSDNGSEEGEDGCSKKNAQQQTTWYPDIINTQIACTNNPQGYYPSSWDTDMSIHDLVMFNSSSDCCDMLLHSLAGDYGSNSYEGQVECLVIDTCAQQSSPTSSTKGLENNNSIMADLRITLEPTHENQQQRQHQEVERRLADCSLGYHPDVEKEQGCTNSPNYPPPWLRPGLKEKMFYPTAKECCAFFFKGQADLCPVTHACGGSSGGSGGGGPAPGPGPATQTTTSSGSSSADCPWHVDINSQDGCSNDKRYPIEWTKPPANTMMFFDTPQECCERMFKNRSCKHNDRGCDPNAPVDHRPPPTPRPTPRPTKRPTPQPTKRPTLRPTRNPTQSPTVTPLVYYVEDMSGMCVSNYETEPPHWIKSFFPIYEACCNSKGVRDVKLCLKKRPNDPFNDGTPQPTPTPPPVYYADPVTGMCMSDADQPKPAWLTTTFDTFKRCCALASREPAKCLENEPKVDDFSSSNWPTSSNSPTPLPAPKFYLQDSTGMCVDANEVPMPYQVPQTFTRYEDCCKMSWATEKCLASAPTPYPTLSPSYSPSTPWPTEVALCPEALDESGATKYRARDQVEVNGVVYECRKPPNAAYCNQADFRPPLEDPGPEIKEDEHNGIPITNAIPLTSAYDDTNESGSSDTLWKEAWTRLYACIRPPTFSPTSTPTTYAPTCTKTRWHPGPIDRKICTNDDDYPTIWNDEPLRSTYFVDTAEECCEKFYPGSKCRIRPAC